MKTIACALLAGLLASPVQADENLKKVQNRLESEVNKILVILKDKKIERDEKRTRVMKIVDGLFDLKLTGKLVLGRTYWPKFDEKQREQFIDLFVAQVKDSYFEKVDLLTDESVEFEKAFFQGKKIHVKTRIVAKDKRYEMIYKLYLKEDKWLVYDVEIEGISVIKSYSSQYDQYLRKNSIPDLLKKMKEKTIDAPKDLRDAKTSEKKKA